MYEPTIKVRHAAQPHDPEARTQVPTSRQRRTTGPAGEGPAGDRYARESFTLRRMRPRSIAALAIVAVVLVVLGLLYV